MPCLYQSRRAVSHTNTNGQPPKTRGRTSFGGVVRTGEKVVGKAIGKKVLREAEESVIEHADEAAARRLLHEAEERAKKEAERLAATPRVVSGAHHIFGPKSLAKQKLGPVLSAFGGDELAAFRALEEATQLLADTGAVQGVFHTTIHVAGQAVTVRGAVLDGAARVSTAFIP